MSILIIINEDDAYNNYNNNNDNNRTNTTMLLRLITLIIIMTIRIAILIIAIDLIIITTIMILITMAIVMLETSVLSLTLSFKAIRMELYLTHLVSRMIGKRPRGRKRLGMLNKFLKESSYAELKRKAENRKEWRIWKPRTCLTAEH